MNNLSRNMRAWLAVISCCAGIFWSGSLIFGFPGVMGEYWRETFSVSTAATSKITMFVLLGLACFSFFSGKFHLRFGTRKSFLVGTVLIVASMFVLLFGKNIYMVYLWAALNGASSMFIYSPGLATVQRWIPHKKGLVTGMVNLVFGISAAIMSPIFKGMLTRFDYKNMLTIVVILIVVVNLLALIFCEMPEFVKLSERQKKDHHELLEKVRIANEKKGVAAGYFYKPKEAIKTVPFWCMCVIWACMGAAGISMVTLSTNYAAYLGITSGVVILTVFNITNGLSRIVAGFLSDKIGGRTVGCIAFVAATIGYFGLNFGTSFVLITVFAACVGYGFGTMFAVSSPILTDIYGIKYFGLIFGLVFMSYGFLGGILGPNLYGVVLQSTGSYHPVFIYLGIFALISAIMIQFVKPLRKKEII
ncbi:MAG: MFS transporter [Eubacterium sp.]|nr:MFS transporter [Eubacterium sp.]